VPGGRYLGLQSESFFTVAGFVLEAVKRRQALYKLLGEILWWIHREHYQATFANEYVGVEDLGHIHERACRIFGRELPQDCCRVAGLTYLAVDLWGFGPLVGVAELHVVGVEEKLLVGF
jgi:hypothetical protein